MNSFREGKREDKASVTFIPKPDRVLKMIISIYIKKKRNAKLLRNV